MDKKSQKTIEERIAKNKKQVINLLEEYPVVQTAIDKAEIVRSTYYRWVQEDKHFAQEAEAALKRGKLYINDVAETGLIKMVKDEQLPAIKYWLRHHHDDYDSKGYPIIYART